MTVQHLHLNVYLKLLHLIRGSGIPCAVPPYGRGIGKYKGESTLFSILAFSFLTV